MAPPTNTGTFDDDDVAPTNTGTFDDDRRNLSPDDTSTDTDATGTMTGMYDDANASHPNGMCPGDQPYNGVNCAAFLLDGNHGLSCPYNDYDCHCAFK